MLLVWSMSTPFSGHYLQQGVRNFDHMAFVDVYLVCGVFPTTETLTVHLHRSFSAKRKVKTVQRVHTPHFKCIIIAMKREILGYLQANSACNAGQSFIYLFISFTSCCVLSHRLLSCIWFNSQFPVHFRQLELKIIDLHWNCSNSKHLNSKSA